MASLWKRPNSRFWTACFTDRNGKQRKRSTGTTDRRAALRLAEQFEEAGRKRRTAKQVREVIGSLHREITGEELTTVTVRGFVAGWLARKKPETSPATLAFYAGATGKFLAFLGERANGDLGEINREDVTRFRNALAESLAPRTVSHTQKALRMVFKAARRDGFITEDPGEFVDTVRQSGENNRRPFTLPEVRAVLDVADAEWRSLVLFGLYTGQRLADLAALTWANVDLARGEVRLSTRKTGKRMLLALAAPLRAHLESLPAGDDPGAPLHPRAAAIVAREGRSGSLSIQFAELLAQAGLRPKKTHAKAEDGAGRTGRRVGNALSFHCLRRTATTLLHEAGVPAAVAQAFIGHDSEEIHRVYVNVGRETLEKAAAALPALG